MSNDNGWICLHRKIFDNWIWEDKPFAKGQAFIDLLLMANFKERKILLGSEFVNADCGMIVTSTVKLSERWGWSRTKVTSYLKTLELDGMITLNSDNKKTVINIVNFGVYQDFKINNVQQKNIKKATKNQQKDRAETSNKHQKSTNNNVNNVNKETNTPPLPPAEKTASAEKSKPVKEKFAEFVSMTNDEYSSLVAKVGEQGAKRCIEILDNYKGASGKKYSNDYRAILNWVVARYNEEQAKQSKNIAPKYEFDPDDPYKDWK